MAFSFPILNGSIIEAVIQGRVYGQTTLTFFHYRYTGPTIATGPEAMEVVANAMQNTGGEYLRFTQAVSESWTDGLITTQVVYPVRYVRLEWIPGNRVGLVTGAALPPGTSGAITKRANTSGRGDRGTTHMPAMPPSFTVNGVLTTAGITAYQNMSTAIASFIEPVGGGMYEPVIFKKTSPAASPKIAAASPQTTVRTMSRRVVGRGI